MKSANYALGLPKADAVRVKRPGVIWGLVEARCQRWSSRGMGRLRFWWLVPAVVTPAGLFGCDSIRSRWGLCVTAWVVYAVVARFLAISVGVEFTRAP